MARRRQESGGGLRLRLFGALELWRGERALALPQSRKTRALLAYLVAAGGVQRRERLCALFWDVADDPRGALRWSLSKLRPLLDEPDAPRIVATRDGVALDARGLDVDLLRLRAVLASGLASATTPLLAALAADCRGPLLEGLELADLHDYQAWCVAEREAARRQHAALLGELVNRLSQQPDAALPYARQLVQVAPRHEVAHAQLVELLAASGRREEAEQQYEAGTQLLREQGVAPSGELSIAWRQARQGMPASPHPVPPPSADGAPALPNIRLPRTPRPASPTRYAKSGGVNVAYQVVGEGPDLVLVPGWVSHVEHAWEEPTYAHFLRRLASFCRLILLDRRGTGLSDPVHRLPTLEERMDDVRAVMDAAGAARATLFGISEGGPLTMLFAATYPERTAALVLYGTFARGSWHPDYPWRWTPEQVEDVLRSIERFWGTGRIAAAISPGVAADPRLVEAWARFERLSVSPAQAQMLFRMSLQADVRHVLPTIQAPTIVLQRSGDQITTAPGARYLADRIPGATYVEFPGADHFPWMGDAEALLAAVQEFVTGALPVPVADRVLATVLFVDIVGSTARLAEIGDRAWRQTLADYQALVRAELVRFRGREVNTAGDSFLATFDGPARAIQCARAIAEGVRGLGLAVRAGLHTGECEVLDDQISGLAVHIGARVAELADPGEILVSSTVKDLVAGAGLHFAERGAHALAGVPGTWTLFRVEP